MFSGVTREFITKHLPPSTVTAKSHMIRKRQGLRSTKNITQEIQDTRAQVDNMAPLEQVCTAIDDEMFCFSVTIAYDGNVIHSDLPGRLAIESYAGMKYFFVAYIYKYNYIVIGPMKSRKDGNMVATFQDVYSNLKARGYEPSLHVFDNECSKAVKNYITSEETSIQLVEPHNRRVNTAKPAVKCVKHHTTANLATMDPNCPIQL